MSQDLIDAKIACTHKLFEKIIDGSTSNQPDFKIGQLFRKYITKFSDVYGAFEEALGEEIPTFQNNVVKLNKKLKNDMKYCGDELKKAEIEAEQKSIKLISEFICYRKVTLAELDKQEDKALQLDQYEENLLFKIINLENELMDIEMLLQEALVNSTEIFVNTIKVSIDSIKKLCTELNDQLKEKSNDFHDSLKNAVLDQQIKFI